jgi:hypothetical protein
MQINANELILQVGGEHLVDLPHVPKLQVTKNRLIKKNSTAVETLSSTRALDFAPKNNLAKNLPLRV